MTSPTPPSPRSRSQASGRRSRHHHHHHHHHQHQHQHLLHSDCPPELDDGGGGGDTNNNTSPTLNQQRSVSLTTLQPTAVIQPRMAQLETLEAKMASIEVSLSSTPRRKKNGSLSGMSLGSSIRSIPKEIAVKELESLRNALRDKENIIQNLKGQLTIPGLRLTPMKNPNGTNNNRELSDVEKKQAEERLNRLKTDIDNKRLAIKNLKMALERLDITDNIDVRIQQAELEYQLGREELNLLTLLEESRALQLCLDESNKNSSESHTLYSCVNGSDPVILLGIEIIYDPKSPKFGASQKDTMPGLWIDWALEETGMCKGDRLVEVNGKIVLTKSRDDLIRLLSAAPDPAQIVLLRKLTENGNKFISLGNTNKDVASLRTELEAVRERADEAQKTKDNLISDNIRLTHRISYLEEQVSELLQTRNKSSESDIRIVSKSPVISTVKTNQNVTNINITSSQPTTTNLQNKELQVFQKGPQVTALVANLPGLETNKEVHTSLPIRSKSSMSNISNTTISATELQQSNDNSHCHKSHRHNKSRSVNKLEQNTDKITYRKHNHHHHHHHYNHEKDYSSETNSNADISRYNNKKNIENHRYSYGDRMNIDKDYTSDNIMDQSYKKATKIVHELTRNREQQNLYEKHRQKCITASEKYNGDILKHYNSRKSASVLDFRSEIRIGSVKQADSKSVDELDSINNEPKVYKKIPDCRSVKSLDFDSDCTTNLTNGYNNHHHNYNNNNNKHVDYTSEPIENNRKLAHYLNYHHENNVKPRPMPPKKPLRLSLHKTQSLQSVETSTSSTSSPNNKNESRKRNYKGETSILGKIEQQTNEIMNDGQTNKWMSSCAKQIIENGENSSWC